MVIQVVTICFASFFIYTFNWFEALYDADQTKISFLIIIVFIGATLTVGVLSYKTYLIEMFYLIMFGFL